MTFRSLLILWLAMAPGLALAVPRVTVVDHAQAYDLLRDYPTDVRMVVTAPPDWVNDPGVRDTQLKVTAEPTGAVSVTSVHFQPPVTSTAEGAKDRDLQLYPGVFTAELRLPPKRALPKAFQVTLKLGDRTHTVTAPLFQKHPSAGAPGPNPSVEHMFYMRYVHPAKVPRLPMAVYRPRHGDHDPHAYFSWDAPLPAGFKADAGPVTANISGGDVDGLRIELPPPGAPPVARVLGRMVSDGFLALELVQAGHTLAQASAVTSEETRVSRGGPRLKDLWEQSASGISGAATAGDAPTILTFRQGDAGYFWVQYPAPELDATAYSAVARTTGTPVTLLTGTIEALNGRSVVHVVGRFRQGGPAQLTTQLVRILGADEPPRPLAPVELTLPTTDGGDAGARNAWIFHMRRTLERKRLHASSRAFFDFAERALARRAAPSATPEADADAEPRGRPVVDLLSAGTGLLAIQEALQLDAMSASSLELGAATVPLSKLTPPGIASHPFAQMAKGRRSLGFDLDALAPADHLYAHAANFAHALALCDDLETWGIDLAHVAEGRSVDSHVRERYTNALLVESGTLTRIFGDRVVADCGIVLADPFLREGTDLALVLNLKDRALADVALAPRRKLAELAGAATATSRYQDTSVRSWTTKDGAVSLYEADAGTFRILATSQPLLARILDAHAKRAPSLAASDDYRYMRTVFPGDHASEDAFVYLSDAFVRRMVSPAFKLAARRRLLCAGQLTLCHNARLLARIEGRPDDLAALIKAGDLPAKPRCPEGDALTLDGGVPACPHHGRLDRLAALAPERVTRATPDEAKAYGAFVEGYNNFWRTYFDPVGIRVHRGPPSRFETVILPLVENTIYQGLKTVLPPEPVRLAFHGSTKTTVLGAAFALPKTFLEETVHHAYADDLMPEEDPARWLGRELAFVVHDAAPLFTLDFGRGGLGSELLFRNRGPEFGALFVLSSFDLPLVVSAGVSSESAAWRFLEKGLWRARNAISQSRSFFDARFDPYLIRDGVPAPVMALPIDLWLLKLRYFVAVHKGRIWLSNQLPALIASMTAPPPERETVAHVAAAWLPGQGVAAGGERDLAAAERSRRACLANLTPAWIILRLLNVAPANFETEARAALSFVPVCPEGGRYELEPATDAVQCSLHGATERPRQRLAPDPQSAGARAMARLRELFLSLTFTPDGLSTHLELDITP